MRSYLQTVYSEQERPKTSYPRLYVEHLISKYGLIPGSKLVELGAGRGEFLEEFALSGFDVIGIDRDTSAVENYPHIPRIISDLESALQSIKSSSYDIVFMKSLIEHLIDPEAIFSQVFRILRPGGTLIIMTPDWEANYKIFYDDHTHVTPFTKLSLLYLLQIMNFTQIRVEIFRQLPILWRYPYLSVVSNIIAAFTPHRSKYKFLRWSKELQLLGFAKKPI